MSYRVVELAPDASDTLDQAIKDSAIDNVQTRDVAAKAIADGATTIGEYDSAYTAMEYMRRVFVQRGNEPPRWYLLDPFDRILMGPDDLYDVAA